MVNFAGEEDAADARHDTPPRRPLVPEGFYDDPSAPRQEGLNSEHAHTSFIRTMDEAKRIIDAVRPGLTFKADNGATFLDLGRQMSESAKEMHTLDLRVLLAHLDSAASAIKAELDRRY